MVAQILARQIRVVGELYDKGILDGFEMQQLHEILLSLYDEQGRSERLNNFPYPRQFASTALWNTLVFSALVAFGLLSISGGNTVIRYGWSFLFPAWSFGTFS